MECVKNQLRTADAALDRIFVRGEDVYRLAQARGALKQVYDTLEKQEKEGGDVS